MARKKAIAISADGKVTDYKMGSRDGETIKVDCDFTPSGFLTRCAKTGKRVILEITSHGGQGIEPFQITALPKQFTLEVKKAEIPADRLGDMRFLIKEQCNVTVKIMPPADEAELFDETDEA